MPRYIDAERFKIWLSEKVKEGLVSFSSAETTASLLRYAPTADVLPVVHAHWETIYNDCGHYGFVKCTACGDEYGSLTYRYCPNCGAKMDGKETEQ